MNVNEKSITLFRDAPVSKAVFSNIIPSICKRLAREKHDSELKASYESSLQTYHRRYEKAGIVYSAGFVDNIAFNNFIENYLK